MSEPEEDSNRRQRKELIITPPAQAWDMGGVGCDRAVQHDGRRCRAFPIALNIVKEDIEADAIMVHRAGVGIGSRSVKWREENRESVSTNSYV